MKDIDKDTQQSLDLDSNEIYNQLWLELEPKLKRPRRSRKIFLIFFCLFSISCFVVFYNWLADNKISTVERISVANADELSSKVAINNIEFQNNILQNVNNDKVDLLEVNVQNLSDSSNNKFNEQNTKPKSFLGNRKLSIAV